MAPTITPIDASFGATVTDSDLANLDEAGWPRVEAAFIDHAMLVFPGQNLTSEAQTAFGAVTQGACAADPTGPQCQALGAAFGSFTGEAAPAGPPGGVTESGGGRGPPAGVPLFGGERPRQTPPPPPPPPP